MIKTLIVGTSGSGKDKLRELLTACGWIFAKSTTNRPKRYPEEDTYIFCTKEETNAIPNENKFISTVHNGYDYFADKNQIEAADAVIVDPSGVYELIKEMPTTAFEIIYMRPTNKETQKEMAVKRAENPETEAKIFESRYTSDEKQFSEFEQALIDRTFHAKKL